jgi:hypothetical protein
MSTVIVHPVSRKRDSAWTHTYVGDTANVRSENEQATKEEAVAHAEKTRDSLWPNSQVKVQSRPIGKRVSDTPATEASVPAEAPESHAEPTQAPTEAPTPTTPAPAVSVAPGGHDPKLHYGHRCAFEDCDAFVERTGQRGRPPASCEAHRGVARATATVRKESTFGANFYANPCAGPGKSHGVQRTGKRGAQPKYCQRVNCQKARTRELEAKKAKAAA